MTLRETIADDTTSVFLSGTEFAESVTYISRAGTQRSILAVVEREDSEPLESGEVVRVFFVRVANDSTYGIAGSELDLGGDKISFPPRDGMSSSERSIVRITEQDHGMITLRCQ